MNLDAARIVFRARTASETFDLALRWTVQVGGWLYVRLALFTLLPAAALCYLLQRFGEVEWSLIWVLALLLSVPLQGVFTIAASRLMFEREPTVRQILGHYVSRLPAYLATLFVRSFSIGLGVVTVVVLPWAWARVAFAHEACLLEAQGAVNANKRASEFVSGQYPDAMVTVFGLALATMVTVAASDQVGAAVFEFGLQLGRPLGSLFEDGGSLGALLGFFGVVPYVSSARFLAYIDGRTRRDGWGRPARVHGDRDARGGVGGPR